MPEQDSILEELFQEEEKLTEKQKKIIMAAIESFSEKGYAATSTSEIAKKAGVAEGTIFRHYKTKKDLLMGIVSPMMAKLIAPFVIKDLYKVINHEYEHFEDFLRAMMENRIEFLKNNMPLIKILIQEIPFHPELKEQFKEHIAMKVFDRFASLAEYYQKKGQIIDIPPYSAVRMTFTSIFGFLIARYLILPEADWDDEKEIELTIQFIMHGLSAKN
ncbi:TetR/AcrR family transcriptional regulator [Cytobacillus firmus]|jgi:AcrR family transcriptional regulator|uniref:TetR/AcrR family transcriptional regulator n=2 Tax=Cytobacillus firmus TaxID=1399 RepID=A0AA46NZU6_CYTFI|nr:MULTISPECIES: TetR/AcrR family transcriptional regulator [Bacillaceae]EWG12238.1 TetR family transcriptional regulator [Cytobacillus firmus DS1]KML42136.1 TetR family transcriptional regulator [Cytobacillus firmus]MBG9446361.1 TetR family transcriptional regulator [Cytobacillus firmus]MBG9451903.1 TetR family transcriptional regulator [Cytobacillus firmus]MBG9588078.1 TetR family transcriptional regulator [Cytobacillus firmus]